VVLEGLREYRGLKRGFLGVFRGIRAIPSKKA